MSKLVIQCIFNRRDGEPVERGIAVTDPNGQIYIIIDSTNRPVYDFAYYQILPFQGVLPVDV